MNTSNIRDYLVNGLDPNPEQASDMPFMQQLDNWIPSPHGLHRAEKLPGAIDALFTDLTGAAAVPFGTAYCYDDYEAVVDVGAGNVSYLENHGLCCESNGMVFFARPHPSLTMTDVGARLYTPGPRTVFWCGAFNHGLGVALANDSLLNITIDTSEGVEEDPNSNLDHWQGFSCGYKAFESGATILGLHEMPGGSVLVCTENGLYNMFPVDFERFTFGEAHLTRDICNVPMSIRCETPLLVNDNGEALLIGSEGVQKLGYKQTLEDIVDDITRVTFDTYRNTYYICTSEYTYILNNSGLYVLQQLVQAKTDKYSYAESIAALPESYAETVPFTLGVEGIKSLKGVLLRYAGYVEVSFGFREQSGAPLVYTPWMAPDSRGAVNKVVTGYEFTVRMRTSSAGTSISNIDAVWSNAVKTNFSQVMRRL